MIHISKQALLILSIAAAPQFVLCLFSCSDLLAPIWQPWVAVKSTTEG